MGDVVGAVFVREHHRVLVLELVGVAEGVIRDVSAGGLRAQPLTHVALGALRALGEFTRADGACARQCLVEPELGAEADEHAGVPGGRVAEGAHHESFELGRINGGGVGGHGDLCSR